MPLIAGQFAGIFASCINQNILIVVVIVVIAGVKSTRQADRSGHPVHQAVQLHFALLKAKNTEYYQKADHIATMF
jgi:hypothetical protein